MLKFKKQIIFLFGCIALISYLSIHFATPHPTSLVSVAHTSQSGKHMQIYMEDAQDTLVPLSLSINEESNEEDMLQMMFSYMSGKQSIKGFHPLFTKDCNLQKVEIKNGIANLYVDDNFASYRPKDELRVLEAITWGATQFHDVEQVKIYMDGKVITMMPVAKTPIPEILNRSIGINHFETAATILQNTTSLTIYGIKNIEGKEYLVPRSRRFVLHGDTLVACVQEVLRDISASSDLSQPLYADNIEVLQQKMEGDTLCVELNKNILASDKSVKQDVYDTLVLSLADIQGVKRVEVKVDGNVVTPHTQKEEAVSMYEVRYNTIDF